MWLPGNWGFLHPQGLSLPALYQLVVKAHAQSRWGLLGAVGLVVTGCSAPAGKGAGWVCLS